MTVIVRGFGDGVKRFEVVMLVPDTPEELSESIGRAIQDAAMSHIARVAMYKRHMLELEFVGLPESERYFRFGTDPAGMVQPIAISLPPSDVN